MPLMSSPSLWVTRTSFTKILTYGLPTTHSFVDAYLCWSLIIHFEDSLKNKHFCTYL
uniref:Uncharacterized protein n=1 Tax=Lepeophtheirus salmonis TaxID=72036 RepID=A0A0K2V861_LEPSM